MSITATFIHPYIIRAIIAIILISINAAIAGTFTVFRNVSFLVAGAAHAALAGAALAILLEVFGINIPLLLGGIIFAVIVALSAGYASRNNKMDTNTAIAVSFALSMSLAVLFISMIKEYAARVWGLLIGDLFLLSYHDLALMTIATLFVLIISLLFYRNFIFISFDVEGACAYGVNVKLYDYILLSTIAIAVVVIMGGVGAILVFAMFVAPSATASRMFNSIKSVFFASFIIALLSGFFGLIVSFNFPVSPGAVGAVVASMLYFVVSVLKN